MGKDQELLEAARCGNYSVAERILNQRAKKSGPLASLRRGPGPNVQDSNGYTPLHQACLNGHKDIVILLLNHDALANIVDSKGCTPLHLASWSGNFDICEILLKHGSSFPSVNHMNFDHESALHSAAQYGHTDIVKLLLENGCYVSVRNIRNESPLDLASKYGRLETVDCLLNSQYGLNLDIVRSHSPLHLAAKNGHKHVVKLLLDAGFDVNYMTDTGTALHEAAMYGKIEVVKILLDYGVDPNLENTRNRTVFDILGDLNTCISKQIEDIIKSHIILVDVRNQYVSVSPSLPFQDFMLGSHFECLLPEKCSVSELTPPQQFCSPTHSEHMYDIPPSSKVTRENSPRGNDSLSSLTASQSQDSCFDQTSCSSCSPLKCDPSDSPAFENNLYEKVDSDSLLYEIPPPVSFLSVKRYSDPMQQCSIYQNVFIPENIANKDNSVASVTENIYSPMIAAVCGENQSQPPAKPPRKSITPYSAESKIPPSQRSNYEYLCLATSGLHKCPPEYLDLNKDSNENSFYAKEQYIDMSLDKPLPTYENHEIICCNGLKCERKSCKNKNYQYSSSTDKFSEILPFTVLCDDSHRKSSFNNLMPSKSTPALHASRHTLDQIVLTTDKEPKLQKLSKLNFVSKRYSTQFPLNSTSFDQPPTPENPPPSPGTAESGIHEKIHPSGQSVKKKSSSRNIDTITDEQLVATLGPHGEIELILATDNKCVSTDGESSQNNPFAGLHHGSVLTDVKTENTFPLSKEGGSKTNLPVKINNIYENVQIAMEQMKPKMTVSANDHDIPGNNCFSVMSPFDEKAEWAEIAGIMASFGGSISRESSLSQEVETNFSSFVHTEAAEIEIFSPKNLEEWLLQLSLSQYENLLIINGFDDINFLGGIILEDIDLQEIGIKSSNDRQKLCVAAQKLPPIQTINNYENFPESVEEWLKSINLSEYNDSFSNNNITDMDRALKLWEVELNTVLKIPKLGHRKRILASLGEKHFTVNIDSKSLDLSKLKEDLSELENNLNQNYGCRESPPDVYDCAAQVSIDKPYLRIRSPTQLMTDSRESVASTRSSVIGPQWCHHPEELVFNSCNYMAKYLGSTLVKELYGLESTKSSILKLKSSTKDIAKIPSIILSISYSGVKFINAETQKLVCEHEIRNIHCACQDADDLRHFAYITKDLLTHNHYCHVFSSPSVDMASEIILTLGEAFEVAYQIAMCEKAKRSCDTGLRNTAMKIMASS